MRTNNDRIVLERLIASCHDARRGFRTAAARARSRRLRLWFNLAAQERGRFAEELAIHADVRLGRGGTWRAGLHRFWMRIMVRMASHPDRVALTEAARGERMAVAAYSEAARQSLPVAVRAVVAAQERRVRASAEWVYAGASVVARHRRRRAGDTGSPNRS